MNFKEYLVFYKQNEKPASTFFHKHVSKNGAKVFSFMSIKLGFSPNSISVLSLLLLIAGCFFIFKGDAISLWASLILLQISYVCDCSDGVVARFRGLSSQFGAYLDILLDRVGGLIFLITIAYFSFVNIDISHDFLFFLSLLSYYCYHLSASFRPYYFPELKGYMKKSNQTLSIAKTIVKFTYEFIDTGVFYFIISIALIANYIEAVVYLYGLISSFLLAANMILLYKHKPQE